MHSISPSAGSIGGGQTITITGANLPLKASRAAISMDVVVNGAPVQVPCTVLQSNYSTLHCLTSAVPGVFALTRYINHQRNILEGGLQYHSTVVAATYLNGDGDMLRVVSQAQYNDFPDNQRPGIFLVSRKTGINSYVGPMNLDFGAGLLAMLYDPFSRSIHSFCGVYGSVSLSCSNSYSSDGHNPADLISFLTSAAPKYLLVIESHYMFTNSHNDALYTALGTCGGSDESSKFSSY